MRAELERIMDLQPHWSSRKTPEMDERGQLVRTAGPSWLRSFASELAHEVGIATDDLLIEGRDGTGLKTEVPWFRFASEQRSPSATTGWYCVYLFDTVGEAAYLSLGHGSTDWTGTDFKPRPFEELRALGSWGREIVADLASRRQELSQAMELRSRRSELGPAYEAATALCLRYERDNMPSEEALRADAMYFASLLRTVYKASEVLPAPVGIAPEISEVVEISQKSAGKTQTTKGQGFRLSAQQRSAIEKHAMNVVEAYLRKDGWEVEDTSAAKPYDFYCLSEQGELYIEVKGTTSAGETIVLTRNEVEHHRKVWPNNGLALVSRIKLSGEDGLTASGGTLEMIQPWRIEEANLQVVSYLYRLG
jgi:hypothetical protein